MSSGLAHFRRERFYQLQRDIGFHSRNCEKCSRARRITDFCDVRNELVRKALALQGKKWTPPAQRTK